MDNQTLDELKDAGYNRVPVTLQVLADLDTPLSVYLKLAAGPYSYLLESAQGGEKWGRYSIIGLPARTVITVRGDDVQIRKDGELIEQHSASDPIAFVENYHAQFKVAHVEGLPRFHGGLVGYFGYDTVRYVEARVRDSTPPDPLGTPDILLMVSDDLVIFDNLRGTMQLISLIDPADPDALQTTQEKLADRARALRQPVPSVPASLTNQKVQESDFVSSFGETEFKAAVERIREYIVAGDVMQVVLAQRMSLPFNAAAVDMYRALRNLNRRPTCIS